MLSVPRVQLQMCTTLIRGYTKLSCVHLTKHVRVQQVLFPLSRHQSTKSDEAFKEKVYVGELTVPMRGVKLFSLITSVSGLVAQPFLIQRATEIGSHALVVAAYGFIGFFTFVTPILLHLVTRQYVTEIEYDSKTGCYTASTISLFLRRKSITFTPNDVVVPDIPRVFTTFVAKGAPLFVEPSIFKDISHYGKIMGYDKPLDFKMGNIEAQNVKK